MINMHIYIYMTVPHRGVGTGTLDELAGSHTRLAESPPERSGCMHIDK